MKILNEMELKIKSMSQNESFARACVAGFCLGLNLSVEELTDIKTAVSEAVTNCVVHAYSGQENGEIKINVKIYKDCVDIVVSDTGVGIINIAQAREPFYTTKPSEERSGMGFTVMESFMDELEVYPNKNKGLCVRMRKYVGEEEMQDVVGD